MLALRLIAFGLRSHVGVRVTHMCLHESFATRNAIKLLAFASTSASASSSGQRLRRLVFPFEVVEFDVRLSFTPLNRRMHTISSYHVSMLRCRKSCESLFQSSATASSLFSWSLIMTCRRNSHSGPTLLVHSASTVACQRQNVWELQTKSMMQDVGICYDFLFINWMNNQSRVLLPLSRYTLATSQAFNRRAGGCATTPACVATSQPESPRPRSPAGVWRRWGARSWALTAQPHLPPLAHLQQPPPLCLHHPLLHPAPQQFLLMPGNHVAQSCDKTEAFSVYLMTWAYCNKKSKNFGVSVVVNIAHHTWWRFSRWRITCDKSWSLLFWVWLQLAFLLVWMSSNCQAWS